MAEIRLSKLTKQFSIGLARLVDFLNEKGANVEMNPNAKVSDEYLPAIEAKFGEDQKLKEDSEKVTIKLKEIIELGSKKKPEHEEEGEPEREVVIKSNTLNAEPVKEEPVAEVATEPVQAPVAETPKPESGLKIVDKIDLSQFERKAPKEEKPAEPVAEVPTETPVETPAETPAPAEELRSLSAIVFRLTSLPHSSQRRNSTFSAMDITTCHAVSWTCSRLSERDSADSSWPSLRQVRQCCLSR